MSDQRYLVAARKYRPALFKEIVAQEHVTDTLKNAIRLDRLAHAYLFSGPRGVGKTTAARVLAKAINCTTPRDEREDHAEPCRTCDSCQSFEAGRSLNIFEIDAASNNKVDDIRELRETVRIPPQGSKKKVYIIDEVHMLSKQAFNALLKTLEEPPPHALFIFATTEPHKVLPTILSRCQRFDFRRIPVPEVVERLREICEAEGITADEESLMLIARKGDGALRDALSAFDQAVSLCGTDLQYTELTQAMGVVDLDLFFQLTEHVTTQNSAGVLRLVEHIVHEGYDLQEFLAGLAEHLRNLLVACTLDDDELIEAAAATRARYRKATEPFAEADLLRLLMVVDDAEDALKNSSQPRLKLEMALLKMASLTHAADLRDALDQLDRLEQHLQDGTRPRGADAGDATADGSAEKTPAAGVTEPRESYAAPAPNKADGTAEISPNPSDARPSPDDPVSSEATSNEAVSSEAVSSEAVPDAPVSGEEPTGEEQTGEASDDNPSVDDNPSADEVPSSEPPSSSTPADPAPPSEPAPASSRKDEATTTGYRDLFGRPALQKKKSSEQPPENQASAGPSEAEAGVTAATGVATATANGPAATATAPAETDTLSAVWTDFVRAVTQERIQVGSCLQHAAPVHVQDGTVQIAVPDDFHRRQLSDHERLLAEHLTDVLDRTVDRFRFVVEEKPAPTGSDETTAESDPYERMRQLRQQHPVVDMLFSDFGGELVW